MLFALILLASTCHFSFLFLYNIITIIFNVVVRLVHCILRSAEPWFVSGLNITTKFKHLLDNTLTLNVEKYSRIFLVFFEKCSFVMGYYRLGVLRFTAVLSTGNMKLQLCLLHSVWIHFPAIGGRAAPRQKHIRGSIPWWTRKIDSSYRHFVTLNLAGC